MNKDMIFPVFFQGVALQMLQKSIDFALAEDGQDLTTNAVFSENSIMNATLIAKEETLIAGLPFIPLILESTIALEPGTCSFTPFVQEGALLSVGTKVAQLHGSTRVILRAERILLNFITHLSGIANVVSQYAKQLEGTGVRLLDTRKTLPCLRYPEKYAVLIGGGYNHRKNLAELLMLKDNHVDAAGGIVPAVEQLRACYGSQIPIEVECRTVDEVEQAVSCNVARIMLDNMCAEEMDASLAVIPACIEVEISGGVTMETIGSLAQVGTTRKANFISVGRLTHSAPSADFSLITTVQ